MTNPTQKPAENALVPAASAGEMMQSIADARRQGMPISTLLMAHPGLRAAGQEMAQAMSQARGIIGPHLLGQPHACFAVMCKALNWGLDAFEVAQATYTTPGGQIGYYGRLVHAIIKSHPRVKDTHFEDLGDWSVLHGKFERKVSKKTDANGGPIYYMAESWSKADEKGLGVRVWVTFEDGTEGEPLEIWLSECNPRNATTWPTRPRLQIRNVAIRAYANQVDPSLLMGARFDDDDPEFGQHHGPDRAKDVTPKDEPQTNGGSKLDAFAAKHGKGEAQNGPQKPQDAQEGDRTAEDAGEVDNGASAAAGEDQEGNASATDSQDDSGNQGEADLLNEDAPVVLVLADGKAGPKMKAGQVPAWFESQSKIASMTDEKWQALLANNSPCLERLAPIVRKGIEGLRSERLA